MATLLEIAIPIPVDRSVPSLRCNFSWTLVGNLIYAVCQWGMISVLAKSGNAAIVGQFALGLAISAPVFMFTNLQLRGVQATDAHSEYEFADYFTLRCIATLAGMICVAIVVGSSRYDRTTSIVVLLVALSKAVESLSDVTSGLLQKHERLDQVAIGLMIRGAASIGTFASAFWMFRSVVAAVIALVVTWSMVVLCYDFQKARSLLGFTGEFVNADWGKLWRLVTLSLPLGLVMAMVSLNTNLPRYVIEHQMGRRELGIFAALAYLMTAASLIVGALGQSAAVRLSCMFASGDALGFRALMGKLVLFGGLLGVMGVPMAWLIGRPLLTLLYAPEYADHMGAFLIMVATVGVLAVAAFLGYGMTAARKFKAQVPVLGCVLATTFVLSTLLVPRYGLAGAAAALFASSIFLAVGSGLVLRNAVQSLSRCA